MNKIHRLYLGRSSRPILKIVPDAAWPGLYRIHWPDGRVSPPGNLTRAKDAARLWAGATLKVRGARGFRWRAECAQNAQERPENRRKAPLLGCATQKSKTPLCEPL
jgi:hypothetical protein